jgi:putative ABC transport system permease protein
MRIVETLRLAFRGLSSNKMRTTLTMLGIAIGVGVVILVVAIGQGANASVSDQINSMGTNLITVRPNPRQIRITAAGLNSPNAATPVNTLTAQDAKLLPKTFPQTIAAVAPQVKGNVQVRFQGKNVSTSAIGTTASYQQVDDASADVGRWFTDFEDQGNRKVVVVGTTVAQNLTGNASADLVGQQIEINGDNYQVVGMMTPKGAGAFGQDQDDVVIVPLTAGMERLFGKTNIDSLSVSATSTQMMSLAQEQISSFLRTRHHLQPPFPANDDFQVNNQTELLARSESVTSTMTLMLTAVAVICLAVGGIGIMNIMLVSVTERTREIGIRKAIGATPHDIRLQFLIESAIMSIIGGIIGVITGVGGSFLMGRFGWNTIVSGSAILAALVVSAGVGIFFGIYPAGKAASLHPIEALRFE